MKKLAHKFTSLPQGKCPIDDYNQQSLALLIPGSRLNTRTLQALVHIVIVNRQINFEERTKPQKFNTTKIFMQIIFNLKHFETLLWDILIEILDCSTLQV